MKLILEQVLTKKEARNKDKLEEVALAANQLMLSWGGEENSII